MRAPKNMVGVNAQTGVRTAQRSPRYVELATSQGLRASDMDPLERVCLTHDRAWVNGGSFSICPGCYQAESANTNQEATRA